MKEYNLSSFSLSYLFTFYLHDFVCGCSLNSFDSLYLSFASYGFQRWQGNEKRLQECQQERAFRRVEHSQNPFQLVSGISNYISNMKKWLCCSSLCVDLWLVLYCQYLNNHMICRLLQVLFPVLFHIAEVWTCWHWTSCCLQYTKYVQIM